MQKVSNLIGHRFNCPKWDEDMRNASFDPTPLIGQGVEECWFWASYDDWQTAMMILLRKGSEYAVFSECHNRSIKHNFFQAGCITFRPRWLPLKEVKEFFNNKAGQGDWKIEQMIRAAEKTEQNRTERTKSHAKATD